MIACHKTEERIWRHLGTTFIVLRRHCEDPVENRCTLRERFWKLKKLEETEWLAKNVSKQRKFHWDRRQNLNNYATKKKSSEVIMQFGSSSQLISTPTVPSRDVTIASYVNSPQFCHVCFEDSHYQAWCLPIPNYLLQGLSAKRKINLKNNPPKLRKLFDYHPASARNREPPQNSAQYDNEQGTQPRPAPSVDKKVEAEQVCAVSSTTNNRPKKRRSSPCLWRFRKT